MMCYRGQAYQRGKADGRQERHNEAGSLRTSEFKLAYTHVQNSQQTTIIGEHQLHACLIAWASTIHQCDLPRCSVCPSQVSKACFRGRAILDLQINWRHHYNRGCDAQVADLFKPPLDGPLVFIVVTWCLLCIPHSGQVLLQATHEFDVHTLALIFKLAVPCMPPRPLYCLHFHVSP